MAVGGCVGGMAEDEFIAGEFAFGMKGPEGQPIDGIEPVNHTEASDSVVDGDIAPAEMGGFVEENEAKFVGGKLCDQMRWDQQPRTPEARERRRREGVCCKERKGTADAQGGADFRK